jgi:hypothetical protein
MNNTPMSTTPITEEYRQLEVAIYDLKTENNRLRKDLDEATHLNQAISMLAGLPRSDEMDTLVKDGKRLDWLLDENSCIHIERGRYNRFRDWLVKTLHNRSDIDREMETYDFNEIIRDEELTNE